LSSLGCFFYTLFSRGGCLDTQFARGGC
jgi:hypothetical protein